MNTIWVECKDIIQVVLKGLEGLFWKTSHKIYIDVLNIPTSRTFDSLLYVVGFVVTFHNVLNAIVQGLQTDG